MKFITVVVLLFVFAVIVLLVARPSGPSVTTIEHRRDEDEDSDDA